LAEALGRVIERDPGGACSETYDLVVVGGGVYGVALAFEAARQGLRPLLLERDDFGQHTSWNNLRVLHGGVRYLQTADLKRHVESVRERRWLLRHFPELTEPLACLMPLYGRGLHRPVVLRAALAADHWLSPSRNAGLRPDRALPRGRVLSARETLALAPLVQERGLRGAALWYDGRVPDSQRLLIELLRWAVAGGARALNYVEGDGLLCDGERVAGVRARDRLSGELLEYRAPRVVNCAGPWSRELASRLDRDRRELFRPSLAMNAFFELDAPFDGALAVAPPRPGGPTYFLHAWKGGVLAGTYHAPRPDVTPDGSAEGTPGSGPQEREVEAFVADLDAALPALGLARAPVARLLWGFLPASRAESVALAVREVILEHGAHGGPRGLYSVSGVKFTTARRVAEKTLGIVLRADGGAPRPAADLARPALELPPSAAEMRALLECDPEQGRARILRIARDEAVVRPDDLLLRRTDWGLRTADAERLGPVVAACLENRSEGPHASAARGEPA
jgi:glycerol-3-phosphate dehydrogenase